MAELLRTLSYSTRVRIIATLLEKETNVRSLADMAGISESAASHQWRRCALETWYLSGPAIEFLWMAKWLLVKVW